MRNGSGGAAGGSRRNGTVHRAACPRRPQQPEPTAYHALSERATPEAVRQPFGPHGRQIVHRLRAGRSVPTCRRGRELARKRRFWPPCIAAEHRITYGTWDLRPLAAVMREGGNSPLPKGKRLPRLSALLKSQRRGPVAPGETTENRKAATAHRATVAVSFAMSLRTCSQP